jgi:hypothetical protein
MRILLAITATCAVAMPTAALAQKDRSAPLPSQIQQLLGCRGIADAAQRLACFDRQVAAVNAAIASRDLVLIDRERARATSRSLFGFSVPDFGGIFGGDENEVKEIESTVTAVRKNHEGGWMIKLADGSTWSQTDSSTIAVAPRRGDKVLVKSGTFGSFFLRVNGQPGVRVRRIG